MVFVKSIDTVYNGYRFRSRLEARYAVFFDVLGIRWEYEKEGFDLGEAGRYLPDFWLPELKGFVEIKGQSPTEEEMTRAALLRKITGAPVVIVHGEVGGGPWPCFAHDIGHSSGGESFWTVWFFKCECGQAKISWGDGCHQIVSGDDWDTLPHWCGWIQAYRDDVCGREFPAWDAASTTWKAVSAARSARFEFGQTPKR